MDTKKSPKLMRLKEVLVTTSLGWIPTTLGAKLRNLAYRTIFRRLGDSVFIQNSVEFIGASNIEVGDGVYIFNNVRIDTPDNNSKICFGDCVALERGVDIGRLENTYIEIGERTFIGPYTCIAGPGNIKIGKDCLIAAHSGIVANNHNFSTSTQTIREQGIICKGIVIEDDCWLGYGVKVLDGVTIGKGSVIGAGAVITKDIPPYSVAVGVPARPISNRKSSQSISSQNSKDGSNFLLSVINALTEVEKTTDLLYQCLQTANSNSPPQSIFENLLHTLLNRIHQVMQVDTVTVLLQTESEQQLTVCATLGLEEEIAQSIRIPIGYGFAGNIAARSESIIVEDLSQVEVVSPVLRNKGIQSMVGVPILVANQMIGVFHIGTLSHRHFTTEDAQQLQAVADRLGLAIAPLLESWKLNNRNQTHNGSSNGKYAGIRSE